MKTILLLFIAALLSAFGLIVTKELVSTQDIAATMQPPSKNDCEHRAIVKAYRSLTTGKICTYLLQVDNGEFVLPVNLPKGFNLREGQQLTVEYSKIDEAGFITDCVVTDGPVWASNILCINKVSK